MALLRPKPGPQFQLLVLFSTGRSSTTFTPALHSEIELLPSDVSPGGRLRQSVLSVAYNLHPAAPQRRKIHVSGLPCAGTQRSHIVAHHTRELWLHGPKEPVQQDPCSIEALFGQRFCFSDL